MKFYHTVWNTIWVSNTKVMKISEMKKMTKKEKMKNQNKKENKRNQNQKERIPNHQEKLKKSQNAKTNDLSGFILYLIYFSNFMTC